MRRDRYMCEEWGRCGLIVGLTLEGCNWGVRECILDTPSWDSDTDLAKPLLTSVEEEAVEAASLIIVLRLWRVVRIVNSKCTASAFDVVLHMHLLSTLPKVLCCPPRLRQTVT